MLPIVGLTTMIGWVGLGLAEVGQGMGEMGTNWVDMNECAPTRASSQCVETGLMGWGLDGMGVEGFSFPALNPSMHSLMYCLVKYIWVYRGLSREGLPPPMW